MIKLPRKKRVMVVGPSGAGKSTLINIIRSGPLKEECITFDLDFVGYRLSDDWTEWLVNTDVLPVVSDNAARTGRHLVVVGACSNMSDVERECDRLGIQVVTILPSETSLTNNRAKRGDDKVKVAEAKQSLVDWTSRAQAKGWLVFPSADDVARWLED